MHGMTDLVNRQPGGFQQYAFMVKRTLFEKTVYVFGRVKKVVITATVPIRSAEYRAVTVDIKIINNLQCRSLELVNFRFFNRVFQNEVTIFMILIYLNFT